MFAIDFFGIENSDNYSLSKQALDIILEEISKSEFAGKVVWAYGVGAAQEKGLAREDEPWTHYPKITWAEAHGKTEGGPFYGKIFFTTDEAGEIAESFSIFMDDVCALYTDNEAWYNLFKATLERIDVFYKELYDSSVFCEDDDYEEDDYEEDE